jgi:hypothetical protein
MIITQDWKGCISRTLPPEFRMKTLDEKYHLLYVNRDTVDRKWLERKLDDWAMDSGFTVFKGDDILWTWENIKEENAN